MSQTTERRPYWIITSKSRGSIWEKPYINERECQMEHEKQMSALKKVKTTEEMKKVDWVIEKLWYETKRDKVDDDFDKF